MLSITFEATKLTLSSGHELVVSGSLILQPRDIALVLGDNGAGKSTVLSLIHSVLEREERGHISQLTWNSITCESTISEVTSVFQEPRDNFVCRSSADEVILPLLNHSLNASETIDRVRDLVDAVDVHHTELFEKQIDHLSSGEQQKFAIAAALAPIPGVMLWDEALARIDDPAAARIGDLVNKLQGDTILIASTHRPERYERLFGERVSSLVLIERDGPLIRLSQESMSALSDKGRAIDRTVVNLAQRPLWKAYPGQRTWDPAVRLFSNGFRIFGGNEASAIHVDNLEVFARKTRIAACQNLEIREGVNFVVGRNGSGKTTLLQTLAGQIPLNPFQFPPWLTKRVFAVGTLKTNSLGPLPAMRKDGLSVFLPAEPFRWLTDERISDELNRCHSGDGLEKRIAILTHVGIDCETNPEYLSYGQRKLLCLLTLPDYLELACLDEPFADLGMDYIEIAERFITDQCQEKRWRVALVSNSSDIEITV